MKTGFKRNWLMKMVVAFSDGSKSCVMRDCIFLVVKFKSKSE